MPIFRCYLCDEIFDLSMLHDLEGLPFCGRCNSQYREKLKPKPINRVVEEFSPFEKDDHIHIPKTKAKKGKK